jgi:hypothetical protein
MCEKIGLSIMYPNLSELEGGTYTVRDCSGEFLITFNSAVNIFVKYLCLMK